MAGALGGGGGGGGRPAYARSVEDYDPNRERGRTGRAPTGQEIKTSSGAGRLGSANYGSVAGAPLAGGPGTVGGVTPGGTGGRVVPPPGGGGGGGAPGGPGQQQVSYQTQMPDYFGQMMNRLEGLWGRMGESDLPVEDIKAETRRSQSQQMKEAADLAAARGGMWGANIADMQRGFAEERGRQEVQLGREQADFRQQALRDLAGAMQMGLGLTGQMSGHTLGQLAHLRDTSRLAIDAAAFEQRKKEWEDELTLRWQQLEDDQHRWESSREDLL